MTAGETPQRIPSTPRTPNSVLRGIRQERRQTRAEFADAMARIARETGEKAYPDAKYVERLESGEIAWPGPVYRHILETLCGRPARQLGFSQRAYSASGSGHASGEAPDRMNVALRDAVWANDMEVTEFARKVGVDPKTAERWITGGRIPHARYRWKASQILGRDESELWPDTAFGQGELLRLAKKEITPVLNMTELAGCDDHTEALQQRIERQPVEDVIDVLSRIQKAHRSTVHPDLMRHLQDNIRHTVMQYENLDHASLVPALGKQRIWIESLLDECGHPVQRQQLFEIAGATSGMLGYIAVGSGEFPLARAYCLEAFQLGDFAGNANLQAWARGLQSFCEYYAGRYGEALILARDGLNYAQSGPQSVRLTINGAARAMGKLGDVKGVDRAVDEAHELMSLNDVPEGVPSSISFDCYSAAQTASNAATAYVSLAIPEKAQHYAGLALPEIGKSNSPWSRSLVLIDLAFSLIRAKDADLDRASALVHDALTISAGRPIISIQQRTSEFVSYVISRWGDVPQTRTILDAMSAVNVRPRPR